MGDSLSHIVDVEVNSIETINMQNARIYKFPEKITIHHKIEVISRSSSSHSASSSSKAPVIEEDLDDKDESSKSGNLNSLKNSQVDLVSTKKTW